MEAEEGREWLSILRLVKLGLRSPGQSYCLFLMVDYWDRLFKRSKKVEEGLCGRLILFMESKNYW